jgi:GIY-YIG catalytic domain
MSYTIYALSAPAERIELKDIRYIGMSIDIFSRFKQHLTPHDDTNPAKTEWIQGLLVHGRKPTLGMIEEIGTKEEAGQREQYWIRFAMARGADLLNRAITYTEEE